MRIDGSRRRAIDGELWAGQAPAAAAPGRNGGEAAKVLGLGGGVVELIDRFEDDAYRAVYTVRFASAVYVVHAFKKKSKTGIKTPQTDIDLIKERLKDAEADNEDRLKSESTP